MNKSQELLHKFLLGEGYDLTDSPHIYTKSFTKLGTTLHIYIDFRESSKYPVVYAYKDNKPFESHLLTSLKYNLKRTVDRLTNPQENVLFYY